MRSDIYRQQGKMRDAEADYKKALAIARALPAGGIPAPGADLADAGNGSASRDGNDAGNQSGASGKNGSGESGNGNGSELTPESVARRFTALRTLDNDVDLQQDFVSAMT